MEILSREMLRLLDEPEMKVAVEALLRGEPTVTVILKDGRRVTLRRLA